MVISLLFLISDHFLQVNMAEICETDLQDVDQAMTYYAKAVDSYQGEEKKSTTRPG